MSEVVVIRRAVVPTVYELAGNGTQQVVDEHRDLSRHPALLAFIPENARVEISWAFVAPGQVRAPETYSVPSLIVVCRGSGALLGDTSCTLEEGDVVAVGPGCRHGFVGRDPQGLQVLAIQFEEHDVYEDVSRLLRTLPPPQV